MQLLFKRRACVYMNIHGSVFVCQWCMSTSVYTTYHLMEWCAPVYDYAHVHSVMWVYAIISYTSEYLCTTPYPGQNEIFHFERLVSRSASSSFVPHYCYTCPLWYRHQGCPIFCSGMRVTDLPPIQSSNQPGKIEKWTSELNYHEESTPDEEFVAKTSYRIYANRTQAKN